MPEVPAQPATESPHARRLLSWPLLTIVAALPSIAAWSSGGSMASRDTASLYAPVRTLVSEALRAGRLPLWNPWEGTGKPLLADGIHGVLHPLSLVAALLDPGGVDLLIALYLVAAALGAWVLARELGLERSHATLAGAAFALSGFVLSMAGNLVFLAGAASMPWQVAALAAAGRKARFGLPLAAFATAVSVLSGDAQVATVSTLLGGAFAASRAGWRGAGRAAVGTSLGLLAAAIQLLPTLAAIGSSARHAGLSELEGLQWALSPWRLPELVLPGLFTQLDTVAQPLVMRWLGGPSDAAYDLPFSLSVFVGGPALALAACAPARDRRVRTHAVSAAVLLWLALGHFAGARQALEWIPIWGLFRYSEKLVAPLSLLLALLAAFGAAGPDGDGPAPRRLGLAALATGGFALATWIVAAALAGSHGPPAQLLRANVESALLHPVFGGAALTAAALLFPRSNPWRSVSLVAVVTASLLAALPYARILKPREPCRTWPGVLAAEPPGPRLIVPYLSMTLPHASFEGRQPAPTEVIAHDECGRARLGAPSNGVRDRIGSFWSYGGIGSRRLTLLVQSLPDAGTRTSRHFSVTHAALAPPTTVEEATLHDLAAAGGRLVARDPEYPIELHEVPHAPWARFATELEVVPGLEVAATRFAAATMATRDPAIVESERPVPVGSGEVRLRSYRAEGLALDVEANAEGLVIVNEAFWPGWVARVDGREATILPTNVLSRGVVVPAGHHALTMDYEPPELTWGLALSILGLLAILFLALRGGSPAATLDASPTARTDPSSGPAEPSPEPSTEAAPPAGR